MQCLSEPFHLGTRQVRDQEMSYGAFIQGLGFLARTLRVWRALSCRVSLRPGGACFSKISFFLPSNQRQHCTLQIQKYVLLYSL